MSVQNHVTPAIEQLVATANVTSAKGLPPVHLWNPPYQGMMDMQILRDGTWIHEGRPIQRPALVRLFASILRRDPEGYRLVTPVEMVGITVEDAPFVAVDVTATGTGADQVLTFQTNVGDTVTAGPDHAVILSTQGDEAVPYLHVRAGLNARIDRKTYYRLVDLGCEASHQGALWFGLWSGGRFFPLAPAAG